MLQYRPYQAMGRDASIEARERGVYKQLLCFPTGTGKTPLLAGMRGWHNITNRQMVLVHREELATQAKAKIQEWNPKLRIGIEMADSYANDSDDVVIASVPTIGRENSKRLERFKRDEFGLISTDEAHHGVADSYKRVYNHFGALDPDSKILNIGVTATMNRADNQGLGQIYDEVVAQYSILEAISDGYLVNLRGFKLSTEYTSLDSVATLAGDFAQGDLGRTVNTKRRNLDVVRRWKDIARTEIGYRQTVAFCVDVKHAQDLADAFNSNGIKAEAIWAGDKDRARKLLLHREDKIKVLCNCGILTEGYDDWRISCIIMARPTKSGLLFTQMVGRGTRIPSGIDNILSAIRSGVELEKTDCIVLDVVDSTRRHSLVTLASLFGLAPKADLQGKPITEVLGMVEEVKSRRPGINLDELQNIHQLATNEVDLFADRTPVEVEQNSKLRWTKTSDTEYSISLPLNEKVRVYKNVLDKWDVQGVVCGKGFVQHGLNDLPEAFRVGDNFVTMFGKQLLNLLRREPIKQRSKPVSLSPPASVKQKNYIRAIYKNNSKVMAELDTLTSKRAGLLISTFNTSKAVAPMRD